MRPAAAVAALLAALALLAPAAALGAQARTSLADLEDEVMCVECGTPLEVSQSPVAQQERAFIRREVAAGKTKAQIKSDLVDEYGQAVLAEPSDGGTVLGIDVQDDQHSALAFLQRKSITFPSLRDRDRSYVHRLGVTGYPESFLIDRKGRVVALNRGPITQGWLDANLPKVLGSAA